jgi:thiol:disulfide interchange protein DsbD
MESCLRRITTLALCAALTLSCKHQEHDDIVLSQSSASSTAPDAPLPFLKDETEGVLRAQREGRPLLLYFHAQWSVACKELETKTFMDPRVRAASAPFVAISVDTTNDEDPQVQALMKKYKVAPLPTVILINRSGTEVKRFSAFVDPENMVAALAAVK